MATYVLSYDKLNRSEDPFEKIVELLINNRARNFRHLVESTLIFEWEPRGHNQELHDLIESELKELCFYCLAKCNIFIDSYVDDTAKPSRKERIENIIRRLNN